MKKWMIAVLAAMALMFGAGTTFADTMLYSPMLSPPVGGQIECNVTNVGKKTLTQVTVFLVSDAGAGSVVCNDLPSVVNDHANHTCHNGWGIAGLCKITITGGNHRSVRAVLNVVDSSGATILSVPATK